jgi:hypothetical protein
MTKVYVGTHISPGAFCSVGTEQEAEAESMVVDEMNLKFKSLSPPAAVSARRPHGQNVTVAVILVLGSIFAVAQTPTISNAPPRKMQRLFGRSGLECVSLKLPPPTATSYNFTIQSADGVNGPAGKLFHPTIISSPPTIRTGGLSRGQTGVHPCSTQYSRQPTLQIFKIRPRNTYAWAVE